MVRIQIALVVFSIGLLTVEADYQCLCNYNVELPVYSSKDSSKKVIGYLYEFDCKPMYAKGTAYHQIQYEHKIGFIENGNGIQIQVCQGSIPSEDLVKTTVPTTIIKATVPTTTITRKTTVPTTTTKTTVPTTIIKTTVPTTIIKTTVPTTTTITTVPTTIIKTTVPATTTITTVSTTTRKTTVPTTTTKATVSTTTRKPTVPTATTKATVPTTTRKTTVPTTTTRKTTVPTTTTKTTVPTTTRKTAVLTTIKPSCPHNWILHGTSCYMFHTNSHKEWDDANHDCVSRKSHLAIIENQDEFTFIKQQLQHKIGSHIHSHSDSAWIAGKDNNNEGTWEWYDGLTDTYKQFTYTKWGNNEPDSGDGDHDEDCMTMLGNNDFKWADYSCDEKMYYVCEQSALHTTQAPSQSIQNQDIHCPRGWVLQSGSCYYFHTSHRYSWSSANHECANKNSHLVAIDSESEFNFLKQELDERIDSHISDDSDTSAWTGGGDANREGHWEWYDSYNKTYKNLIYENWGHDEPDSNHDNSNEDCIAMVAHKSYKWADYSCETEMFYVCEQLPAVLLAAQTHIPNAYCPPGWVMNNRSCYLLHTDSQYTWNDSNSFCAAQQSHLVIIESTDEDYFLKQMALPVLDLHHTSASALWTAGNDHNHEGRWEWIDGFRHTTKPMDSYTNWHHGEPDSGDNDHDEDCMCLIGRSKFEWQDYSCNKRFNFICEKSVSFPTALVG